MSSQSCIPDSSPGGRAASSDSELKRRFEDTPQRAKQVSGKKSRTSVAIDDPHSDPDGGGSIAYDSFIAPGLMLPPPRPSSSMSLSAVARPPPQIGLFAPARLPTAMDVDDPVEDDLIEDDLEEKMIAMGLGDDDGEYGNHSEVSMGFKDNDLDEESQAFYGDDGNDDDAIGYDMPTIADQVYAASQAEIAQGLYSQTDSTQVTKRQDPSTSIYEQYSLRLRKAYHYSIEDVLYETFCLKGMPDDGWIQKRKQDKVCKWKRPLPELRLMLISYEPLILKHIVRGNLARAAMTDKELGRKLQQLYDAGNAKPCIYEHYLVNNDGIAPTPNMLYDAMDTIELYLKGRGKSDRASSAVAAKIDNAIKPRTRGYDSDGGERRYCKNITQEGNVNLWIEATRDRLYDLDPDEPLKRTLVEVGYALNGPERLQQHRSHSNSNYIMNLVEAVFSISNYKERYFMKQFIVHHIYRASHAMYEEILIARLGLGYTCFGGGFSYCAAGISGRGAADREEREELYYQKLEVRVFKDKSFLQRFEKEEEKVTAESELYLKYAELVKEHKRANKESKEIAKQIKEAVATRLVNGFGKTGFYRPTALLVKPYINLAVTVHNHPFFMKTSIFKYFKAFFLGIFCDIKALYHDL
jgi:hypothetical protein